MKKIFLASFLILTSLSMLTGCNISNEKSERVLKFEEQEKYKELDIKVGLEDSSSEKFNKLLEPEVYMHPEYSKYRDSKIKSEEINENVINEVVNRATYLANIYYNDSYNKPINYIYMEKFNDIDLLGPHLKKDLALKLLNKCANFGTIEEINNKIKNNDPTLYWYNYVGELLTDYCRTTSDFSDEEKKVILTYLTKMKNYVPIKIQSEDEWLIEKQETRLSEETKNIKNLLLKYSET